MDSISKLKQLELGHNIASCCDYVPEYSEEMVNELKDEILQGDYSKEDIKNVLVNYEGNSDGDMVSKVMNKIVNLKNN